MSLPKQNVPIILGRGIDTKTDPKQVVAGQLLSLENAVFQKTDEYIKRNGTQIIGTGSSMSSGNFVAPYKSECVAGSEFSVYSYDKSQNTFDLKGSRVALDVTTQSVVRNSNSQNNADSAIHSSGVSAFTWQDLNLGTTYYCITDTFTNEYVVPPTIVSGATHSGNSKSKVVAFGNYFVFFYTSNAGVINAYYVLATTPKASLTQITWGTAHVSAPSNDRNNIYNIAVFNNRIYVAYATTTGQTAAVYIDTSFTVSSVTQFAIASRNLNLMGDASNNVWIYYSTDSTPWNVGYTVYDSNLVTQITQAIIFTSSDSGDESNCLTGYVIGTEGIFIFDRSADAEASELPTDPPQILVGQGDITGTVNPDIYSVAIGVCLASRVFFYNGVPYILGFFISAEVQRTYFLFGMPSFFTGGQVGNIVAKLAPSTAGDGSRQLTSVNQLSSNQFQFTYLLSDLVESLNGTIFSNAGVQSAIYQFGEPTITATGGENLLMSGSLVQMYDGLTVAELGYNIFPDNVTFTQSSTGGVISPGTYQYLVTYEWTDNQGQIHRSAPGGLNGGAITVVVPSGTSTNMVTLTLPNLTLTAKQNVLIVVYRTEANQGVFFRVNSVPTMVLTVSNPNVPTQDYNDIFNDTDINGNEQLYTTGGIIENIAAPALSNLVSYNSRMFGITEEDPLTFLYSQQILAQSPVEFNDSFTVRIEERNGPMTAMGVMDTNLIIFKSNSVYYMNGTGPSPNGLNNDFSTPQLVTTDTGCQNQRSIVPMPQGIMFQSPKGIYLLDRSLQSSYIGAPVEAFNNQTVTSAVLITNLNQVRYTMSSGVILCYNYFFSQWSVFTNQNAADSCIFNTLHTYIQPTGSVIQETPNAFLDWDQTPVLMSLQTSWLSFATLQGFQRVYQLLILGDWISAHNLQVNVNYDFVDNSGQTTLIPVPIAPVTGVEQFRVFLQKQKCEAVQIEIQELQPTPSGQGLNLSGLSFIAGIKKGQQKVQASVSYG